MPAHQLLPVYIRTMENERKTGSQTYPCNTMLIERLLEYSLLERENTKFKIINKLLKRDVQFVSNIDVIIFEG